MRNNLFRRLSVAGIAAAAVVAVTASAGQAADPFVAGERSTRTLTLATGEIDRAVARGRTLVAGLGVAAARHTVQRLDDRFDRRVVDEVTSFDTAGRAVAISQFELDGSVAMSVALGWRSDAARAVTAAIATDRAAGVVGAAGLAVAGRPVVRSSAGGWTATWPRVVGGVPVRGDGVRVLLFADGSFHGLTRTQRPLAPAPPAARRLPRDAATAAAQRVLAGRSPAAADLRLATAALAWVAPTIDGSGNTLDSPDATLRLAWVVRFDAGPSLADRVRSVEIWLDAGDGHELGGDVAE